MIIYLIKLILILVFNIGINTYYINSGCKCCGNTKSGGTGSGSKSNLNINPPKGTNPLLRTKPTVTSPDLKPPILGPHMGEIGGGGKGNLVTNPPKGTKTPIVKPPKEVKPKKGAHMGGMKSGEWNGLKGEKDQLIQRLNDLISANDALGDYKIDIPNYDISSLKDESKIALLKDEMELYKSRIECKKLQKDCLSMFEAINTENEKLLEKEDISEFSEESIQNEMDIDKLGKIYEELTAKKQKISETFSEQENLLSNVKENNIKLKNLIGNFYENEILETPFDAKINNAKSLSELECIKSDLDYILGKVFVSKRIGSRDYEVIYYDKLENDLKNDNIYRIMQIMNTFIYRASRELAVNLFLLYKNKTDLVDPFGEEGYIKNVFEFFYYLFLKSDSFRNAFMLLLENISGNSFFANSLKSIFYDLNNGIHRYDLKKSNVEFSEAVLILESKKAKKIKDFLDKNGIKLGEQKEESKLRSIKSLSIEILNEKVYEDARRVIAYKNYKASKAKDNK